MHAFTVHPQKPVSQSTQPRPRRPWRRWSAFLVLLLGAVGLVWAMRPDPHLSRAQALQKDLFSPEARNLSPEERKARFAEYREHVKHLNDDQKWELSAPMREKQKAEMDRYFAMSPAERTRYLDEQIDRSEKMRQAWKEQAAQGKAKGKGQAKGRSPGGGFGPGGKSSATQAGKGGRPPRSTEEIQQRRKQHLDRTSPEERARMDRFRKDMADRRKQRGLPTRG